MIVLTHVEPAQQCLEVKDNVLLSDDSRAFVRVDDSCPWICFHAANGSSAIVEQIVRERGPGSFFAYIITWAMP